MIGMIPYLIRLKTIVHTCIYSAPGLQSRMLHKTRNRLLFDLDIKQAQCVQACFFVLQDFVLSSHLLRTSKRRIKDTACSVVIRDSSKVHLPKKRMKDHQNIICHDKKSQLLLRIIPAVWPPIVKPVGNGHSLTKTVQLKPTGGYCIHDLRVFVASWAHISRCQSNVEGLRSAPKRCATPAQGCPSASQLVIHDLHPTHHPLKLQRNFSFTQPCTQPKVSVSGGTKRISNDQKGPELVVQRISVDNCPYQFCFCSRFSSNRKMDRWMNKLQASNTSLS